MYTLHHIYGWTLINHETICNDPIVIRVSFVKDTPGLPGASVSAQGNTLSEAVDKCRALVRSMEGVTSDSKLQLTYSIRARGWAVGVHNDYRSNGVPSTFWMFTKGDFCVRGEGPNDEIALAIVRREIERVEATYGLAKETT